MLGISSVVICMNPFTPNNPIKKVLVSCPPFSDAGIEVRDVAHAARRQQS